MNAEQIRKALNEFQDGVANMANGKPNDGIAELTNGLANIAQTLAHPHP